MKSIKPGRGPSAMGGIGSVFAALFGVIWTAAAASMGAPLYFCLFGVLFILLAVVQGVYHWKNATSKERFSAYDIVDSKEEGDPANQIVAGEKEALIRGGSDPGREVRFCPYCGVPVEEDFEFCGSCGKKLPDLQ